MEVDGIPDILSNWPSISIKATSIVPRTISPGTAIWTQNPPEPTSPRPDVVHCQDVEWLIEDLFAAVEWMKLEAGSPPSVPVFLFGESYGAVVAFSSVYAMDHYNCKIHGVISSGGLLQVGAQFLPPAPVVAILCALGRYYPKIIMPATDFESTFDDAFGDKEWARTARADSKAVPDIRATIGAVAATLSAGKAVRVRAKEFPCQLYAIHGIGDVRTSCVAMEEFVDQIGPSKATMHKIDTPGHQLLQDQPDIIADVFERVRAWILKESKKT